MIQPNELRIGNYITDLEDRIIKIEAIGKDAEGFKGYYVKSKPMSCIIDTDPEESWLRPLPLTEYWLFKFGFELNNTVRMTTPWSEEANITHTYLFGSPIHSVAITYEPDYGEEGRFLNTGVSKEIKYVHHLQNIVHALIGTELTIKEKEAV